MNNPLISCSREYLVERVMELSAELEKVREERECSVELTCEGGIFECQQSQLTIERDQALADCKAMAEALDHYSKLEDWRLLPVIAREALTPGRRERYLNQTPMPCPSNE